MRTETLSLGLAAAPGVALWIVVIFLPLATLWTGPTQTIGFERPETSLLPLIGPSAALAGLIAVAAVVLGYVPGCLLAAARRGRGWLLFLFLAPVLLPRYVLYYAWRLLQTPTTPMGQWLSGDPALARLAGAAGTCLVMILWYWPLAGLLIAQGRRSLDREALDAARLEAPSWARWAFVTLPLLRRSLILAFGVCFVFALGEFGIFHLAGIRTMTTELKELYLWTGSSTYVARASWPLAALAGIMGISVWRQSRDWTANIQMLPLEIKTGAWGRGFFGVLLTFSMAAPMALLIGHTSDFEPWRQFWRLHGDELYKSLVVSAAGAVLALWMAAGALEAGRLGRVGSVLSAVMQITLLAAMFLPGSLAAAAMLKMLGGSPLTASLRQSSLVVSAGLAARFAGMALLFLHVARDTHQKHLSEMARLDGAGLFVTFRYIHLPRTWPMLLGGFVLAAMFGMTEFDATMLLLPAGVPNFAQNLLNQMHYMRDQHVIVSCLALIGVYIILGGTVVLLVRLMKARSAALLCLCASLCISAGCNVSRSPSEDADVLDIFGGTGRGPGQFIYPRGIDIAPDGSLFVVDKTGRIQHLSRQGQFLSSIQMPLVEQGQPTGFSLGPDGNLYVADTYYHRVMIFTPEGRPIGEFGGLGQNEGQFIYPTDVVFSPDGRLYVGEYGGNDRISVFIQKSRSDSTPAGNTALSQWTFLFSFGRFGSGPGEFSRPSALCADFKRQRLYIADACNHRIALYDFDGRLQGYFGSAGREPGQLRYPYDLALLGDGTLVVCEYGNNRLQLFAPDGRSVGVVGRPGRGAGELAYPWGVAVDARRRAYVVDAGNNRIQVWQL